MQKTQSGPVVLQSAIYRVALSLDSFLVNGIQFGLLQGVAFGDFLQRVAGNLQRDLESLEEEVDRAFSSPTEAAEALASVRSRCEQLIDLLIELRSFRSLPLSELRLTVSLIAPLRAEVVRVIEELEARLQTSDPFYRSRPAQSAVAVGEFLAGLERAFVSEWNASQPVVVDTDPVPTEDLPR